MGYAKKYGELKNLSKEELIDIYDAKTKNTVVGTRHYLEEIERRVRHEENRRMVRMTRQMRNMTIGILVLTVLNVFFILLSVFR